MLLIDEIKEQLSSRFEGADYFDASMDGNHLSIMVAWDGFEGLMPVKRQQMVYSIVNDYIASGEVHAVHMKLYSPSQWVKAKHFI